jgi:hypothetical protein
MTADLDLDALAGESPFIFGGEIRHDALPAMTTKGDDSPVAVVAVDEVIRVPHGLTGFAASRVTVHLVRSLASGRYIFFADLWAVGSGIAVRERAHLEASRPAYDRVAAAVQNSHTNLIEQRLEAATLAVLGTLGKVRALTQGTGRPRGIPWAEAPLVIEKVLKGPSKLQRIVVVGPRYGSRRLPSAPALRPGLHAIFFLTAATREAKELLNPADRDAAFLIATSRDIQPPEQLAEIERILGGKRKK